MAGKMLVALALVGAVCWIARSAPILPDDMRLSDEVRTTAGIGAVRLIIPPLPTPLVDAGISRNGIREDWKKQLEENHVKVVDDGEAPVLRLVVIFHTDESLPDAASYLCFLTLEQPVTVRRLDRGFTIPTWTGAGLGMKPMPEMARGFRAVLSVTLGKFLMRSRTTLSLPRSGDAGQVSN